MDWREKVTYVSEKVFPGLSQRAPTYAGNEVITNLPLQMSLFFNVTFFPVWLLVMAAYFNNEHNCAGNVQKFILITVFIAVIITEVLRLYLGYQGNLKDKISELAAFWLLSLMLQMPLEGIILLNPYFKWQVVEFVAHSTMSIMLIFQIIIGYCALKTIARHHATIFRILKMKNAEINEERRYKSD